MTTALRNTGIEPVARCRGEPTSVISTGPGTTCWRPCSPSSRPASKPTSSARGSSPSPSPRSGRLQQLVLNLIMNGIDAMAEVDGAPAPAGHLVRAWARRRRPRRPRRRAGRGGRGCGASPREALRSLLHDQAGWPGDGVVDRPFYRSGSRRTAMGPPQRGSGADLLSAASENEQTRGSESAAAVEGHTSPAGPPLGDRSRRCNCYR